jgi:hypothetical protein
MIMMTVTSVMNAERNVLKQYQKLIIKYAKLLNETCTMHGLF